jgi:hypothetical protein
MKARLAVLAAALLAAACAGPRLVPGQSSAAEVEAALGPAADKRVGAGGETVLFYPRLPWGYATYAARISPGGTLVAIEQRLTLENTARLKPGASRAEDVLDLLGPPFEPMKAPLGDRVIWTYPMRLPGDPTPKWFLVQLSGDGVLRETYFIDDPNHVQRDSPGFRK